MITNTSRYQFDRIELAHRMIVEERLLDGIVYCMTSFIYSIAGRDKNLNNQIYYPKPLNLFSVDDLDQSIDITLKGWMNLREELDRILSLTREYEYQVLNDKGNQDEDISDEETEICNEYRMQMKTKIRELLPLIEEKNMNHYYRDLKDRYNIPLLYVSMNNLDLLTSRIEEFLKDIDSNNDIDLSNITNNVYVINARIDRLESRMSTWRIRRWYLTYWFPRMMVPVARFLEKI